MKKLLTLFALMLVCIGQTFAYDFEVNGIYYNKSGSNATVTCKTSDYNSYSGIVVIPATVTYDGVTYNVTGIGDYAFSGCSSLSFISIPNSVVSIGERAFAHCSGLTSVTIPNSVTSIGYSTFISCTSLTTITVESGNTHYDSRDNCNAIIETASNALIVGCKNTNIPDSVTSIGNYAFYGCSGLPSVTIPNSVTSIGNYAFYNCSGLTSVTIGNSVESIGESAFYNCSGLTSITIPNSVTSIGSSAFYNCSGLTSVTIGNSVESIGESAFYNCSGLTSITIPNSVKSIENYTFHDCKGLTSVTIGNGVSAIGAYAFYWCTSLTSVTIGNGVSAIGAYAFYWCTSLTSITNMAVVPQTISSNTFSKYSSVTLHILVGCKEAYAAANYWKNFTIVDDIPIIEVDAITLDKTVYSCAVGDVIQASVSSCLPTDATIQKVTWSIDDPSIAFVDTKTGQLVGLKDGVTTITATAADGSGVTATAILKVGAGDGTTYTITATPADSSMGTVTGGGTYALGAEVTLTATPNAGYEFEQWSNGSTDNPYTFTATADVTLTAEFERVVLSAEDIDVTKSYIIYTDVRGGLTVDSPEAAALKGTSESGVNQTIDRTNVLQQFVFVGYAGEYYLYSLGAQKYVSISGLTEKGIDPIKFADADETTVRLLFNASHNINLGGSKEYICDNWSYKDAGNSFKIKVADDFDQSALAEALKPIADGYYVITNPTRGANNAVYEDASANVAKWGSYTIPTEGNFHASDAKYVWKISANSNGKYTLQNVLTGRYMNKANKIQVAIPTTVTATETFTIIPAERTTENVGHWLLNNSSTATAGDVSGYCSGLHAATANNCVVQWGSSAPGSHWDMIKLSEEDISALESAIENRGYVTFEYTIDGRVWRSQTMMFGDLSEVTAPEQEFVTIVSTSDLTDLHDGDVVTVECEENLPFLVTTDEEAPIYGIIHGQSHQDRYIYVDDSGNGKDTGSAGDPESVNDNYLWYITGNMIDGFRLHNKAFDGATLKGTATIASVNGTASDTWELKLGSKGSKFNDKEVFSLYQENVTYLNCQGSLKYWASNDEGSSFYFEVRPTEFVDGTQYTNGTSTKAGILSYTRTFNNQNWQALYVPFSMEYDEWSEKYDIAEIHNFIEYDDDDNGVFDRTYLVVLKKTSGSTEPNYPYLIRAKETGTHSLVLQNKTLDAAESRSIDCRSVKNEYTFTGTYTEVTDMYANGYYAMNGGSLQQPASSSVTLKPQRWYMAVTSRTGAPSATKAQTIRILVDGEDDVEGICKFGISEISKSGNVGFDLTGRAVSTATNVRGITISNGKKVIR